jgi:hypothetical protein
VRFASWVGYDMDGRTDIGWQTCIRYRLEEKAERLASYAALLEEIAPDIAEKLAAAGAHSQAMAALFAGDMTNPAAVNDAANRLTADSPEKLVTLAPTIAALEKLAAASDDDTAQALLVAAAAMRADGLGMSWIHFRVNSSQLQNAIRRRIDPDGTLDLASQAALRKMRELLAEVKPLRSNFAALAIENSTAVRLFLTMAQILQHIDRKPRSACWWPNANSPPPCWPRSISPSCSGWRTRLTSRPCSRPKPRWNTAAASSTTCWPSRPIAPMPACAAVWPSRPASPTRAASWARSPPASPSSACRVACPKP